MNFFTVTHLKPVTYKGYNSAINKWLILFPAHQSTLTFIYTHPNFSITVLRKYLVEQNKDTAVTIYAYLKAIIAAKESNSHLFTSISKDDMQKYHTRWNDLRDIFYKHAFNYRLEQKPSPLQSQQSGVTLVLSDLIEKRDSLPDGSIQKLLLGFYTHIPPVRTDYFATELLSFEEQPTFPNYIQYNEERSYLVITDFKTSQFYKQITNELPLELHTQLLLSLKAHPRKYLFVNKFGNPFTRNGFCQWAKQQLISIFKKGLTLTMIRHIYISNIDFNQSAAVLTRIGEKMGHNITQQMLYKWKDQNNLSEDE